MAESRHGNLERVNPSTVYLFEFYMGEHLDLNLVCKIHGISFIIFQNRFFELVSKYVDTISVRL